MSGTGRFEDATGEVTVEVVFYPGASRAGPLKDG